MTIEARTILGPAVAALVQAGIASARQDARLLLIALGRESAVLPHEDLGAGQMIWTGYFRHMLHGALREPVSRVRGWRNSGRSNLSWALPLDPRPDSETLSSVR